jgi:hypothetical protein
VGSPRDNAEGATVSRGTAANTDGGATTTNITGDVSTKDATGRLPARHHARTTAPPTHCAPNPPATTAPLAGSLGEVVHLQARNTTSATERGGPSPPLPPSTTAAREGGLDDGV